MEFKKLRALIVFAIVGLAGCGSGEESTTIAGTTYTNKADGSATISSERGSISASEGDAAAKTKMADFAPQYPGSTIENALVSERDGVKRTTVVFSVNESPKNVADFYREKFTTAGLAIKSDISAEQSVMMSAEGTGKKASLTVSDENGLSKGTISFSLN